MKMTCKSLWGINFYLEGRAMAENKQGTKKVQWDGDGKGNCRMPGLGFDTNDMRKHYRSILKDDTFTVYHISDAKLENPVMSFKLSNQADSVTNYIYAMAVLRAVLNYEYGIVQDVARHKMS
jgi:hypothetical protein